MFTLFDLDSLLEKINKDNEINFLIGTTNNLILSNKKLHFSCIINVDEQKITYGENLNETIKLFNGRERKLLINIYDLINQKLSGDKRSSSTNVTSYNQNEKISKKIKNDEPWLLNFDNDKDSNTFYLLKKYIRFYYQRILYDVGYLISEMKIKS